MLVDAGSLIRDTLDLHPSAVRLWLAFIEDADATGIYVGTVAEIAESVNMAERTAWRMLKELKSAKIIEPLTDKRGGTVVTYSVKIP